jgi:hypothetical protein
MAYTVFGVILLELYCFISEWSFDETIYSELIWIEQLIFIKNI